MTLTEPFQMGHQPHRRERRADADRQAQLVLYGAHAQNRLAQLLKPSAQGNARTATLPAEHVESDVAQLAPTDAILKAEGMGWLATLAVLLGLISPWRFKLTLSFFLGVTRFLALIGVGVVSALIVAQVRDGGAFGWLTVALFILAPVSEYVDRNEITVPVVLGDRQVARDWNIYAFPTYYILNSQRQIIRRDLGYSTLAGLWWRTIK